MEFEIKPKTRFSLNLTEFWESRELLYFFAWRDIKVKYKQTVLGFLWAIIQPLFMTFVFAFFLGDSIKQKSQLNIPYPLFAFSGMLIWTIFSGGMSNAANSMVNNANIIKKIYFPRLIIPISAILCSLVDFLIAFLLFIVMLFIYDAPINYWGLIYVPFSVIIACLAAIGCGTFLAALNIKYRDVRYVIPFLVQVLLFLTPVLYPATIANNSAAVFLLKLNPVSGALELIRGTFSDYPININTVILSSCSAILLFIVGLSYFRKTESYFADLV